MLLYIKRISFFCSVFLLIAGCGGGGGGGGGGGDDDSDLTLSDLVGSYTLQSFSGQWSNGDTLDSSEVNSFSGTMQINPDGSATQIVEVNGFFVNLFATILSVSNDFIRIDSAGCIYDLGIELKSNTLTATTPMGVCSIDYTETDVWAKVPAASVRSFDSNLQVQIDNEELIAALGGAAVSIYDYLP
jgi:hypothetical protein